MVGEGAILKRPTIAWLLKKNKHVVWCLSLRSVVVGSRWRAICLRQKHVFFFNKRHFTDNMK